MEIHRIKAGETLSRIAAENKTTVSALMKANPKIQDANVIRAKDTLRIPGKTDGFDGTPTKKSKNVSSGDTFVDGSKGTDKASNAKDTKGGDGGPIKSSDVMKKAKTEGEEINRTGGYRFDGKNDCYGFVRRVWNPILKKQGKSPLPVDDAGSKSGSKNWSRIDWDKLKPGAVLSTHEGHAWGDKWHGGIYAGKKNGVHYIYDNSGSKSAKLRPLPSPDYFKYVHTPTLKMLDGKA
ncbi:LysM peptidoglycan-binding domain-containing protein [Pyxidicoccus fallax]|uniref:LysM peptidoglycan-binding domain-containing protein n=1 Tax=Pyxidicoccus fallax TaxID=394095 RepID=A0A848L3Z4_9BACT|nr:LysM peptidoglycan-binding domain-containing protein [Pyxidicoccus fallax]NMO13424.1 LysM peptidoglycan-binding domain-containing protein [Pyxidicoccus fallax]NPC78320.1 LysM peptidoglycan-binding domain-containing protein [Pyxidicoccus fallax]